ncbi:MAG: hypothetical protein JJ992_01595, partial [Planctomycetes bacterium]|nr:hypothetical protein [Planctomycetota bacterium]
AYSPRSLDQSCGSSASKSHRRADSGIREPSPASGNSIWLPILIGSGGGLVLVLIILAIVSMSTKPDKTTYVRGADPTNSQPAGNAATTSSAHDEESRPGDTPKASAAGDAKQPSEQTDVQKPVAAPQSQPNEAKRTAEKPETPSKSAVASKKKKQRTGERPNTKPPTEPKPEPKPDEPSRTEARVATTEKPKPADVEPEPKPESKPGPRKEQRTPQQLFAAIQGFKTAIGLTINGKPAQGAKATQLTQFFQNVLAAAEREATESADRCGLKVGTEFEPILMLVVDAQMEGHSAILVMQGKLLVPDESGESVEVWSHEQELTKFTARANLTTVYNFAREGVGKFFNVFRDAYEEAKKSASAGNP